MVEIVGTPLLRKIPIDILLRASLAIPLETVLS